MGSTKRHSEGFTKQTAFQNFNKRLIKMKCLNNRRRSKKSNWSATNNVTINTCDTTTKVEHESCNQSKSIFKSIRSEGKTCLFLN